MANNDDPNTEPTAEQELIITRVFDAPRELVFNVVATFKGWRPEDIRLIGSRASVMVGDRPSERNRDGEQS